MHIDSREVHMKKMKGKVLPWTLLALGLAIAALGIVLALAIPEGAEAGWASCGPGYAFAKGHFHGEDPAATGAVPGDGHWEGFRSMPNRAFGRPLGHRPGALVLGALVIFGLAMLARRMRRHHGCAGPDCRAEDAVTILRRDFAEGKISEEIYRQRLEALGK
jgi:uncharacterized membrane protein